VNPGSTSAPPMVTDPRVTRRFLTGLLVMSAVFFGVLEAVLQLVVMRGGLHRPIMGDDRLLWMIPLGIGLLLSPLAVLVRLAPGSAMRPVALRTITVLAIGVPLWSALLLEPNLHWAALGLLAFGAATAASRWLLRHVDRLAGVLSWAATVAVVVLIVAGAGMEVARRTAERNGIRALPDHEGPPTPNVLLLVWDTVREQDLSVAGYARRTTPGLEQFAREGVRFSEAFATAPWTLPSHGAMFTGFLEQEMIVGHKIPLGIDGPTLAEVLAQHGYLTAGFTANQTYAGYEYGVDRGFLHFEDYHVSVPTILAAPKLVRLAFDPKEALGPLARRLGYRGYPWRKSAAKVRSDFVSWLDRRPAARPFFAFINFFDAHAPYRPPAPFDTAFGGDPSRRIETLSRRAKPDVVDLEHRAYDGAIAYIDSEVTALLDQLRERGLLDGTLIVIVADHGESFGEKGVYYHASSLYREQLQVPLLFRWSGRIPEGRIIDHPVTLRDLPATIYDLLSLPGPAPFPGVSLARLWDDSAPPPADYRLIAGETTWAGRHANAVIEGGRYFIAWPGRSQELFAFPADTSQGTDLSEDPSSADAMARFRMLDDSLTRRVLEVRGGSFTETGAAP